MCTQYKNTLLKFIESLQTPYCFSMPDIVVSVLRFCIRIDDGILVYISMVKMFGNLETRPTIKVFVDYLNKMNENRREKCWYLWMYNSRLFGKS